MRYYDADAQSLREYFYLNTPEERRAFYFNFVRMHKRPPEKRLSIQNIEDVLKNKKHFRQPMFVIARKQKHYWSIREKIFE